MQFTEEQKKKIENAKWRADYFREIGFNMLADEYDFMLQLIEDFQKENNTKNLTSS